jgi:hypothetical protein
MKYFPVFCETCRRCSLIPIAGGGGTDADEHLPCRFCGGDALVVPGPCFLEAAQPRFERLERAINDAALSVERAGSLLGVLEAAVIEPDTERDHVLYLAQKFGLTHDLDLPADPSGLRRAVSKLISILTPLTRYSRLSS